MFEIEAARDRAIPPPPPWTELWTEEVIGSLNENSLLMQRQLYGQQAWIPLKAPPRQLIQKECTQGLYGRMHDWEITYYEAYLCVYCDGRLEVGTDEGEIVHCGNCIAGWVPEKWHYKCHRCRKFVYKPGV